MAAIFMENFQNYYTDGHETINAAGSPWSFYELHMNTSGIRDDPDVNASADSKAFLAGNSYFDASRMNLPTSNQQMGVASRVYFANMPSDAFHGGGIQLNNAANQSLYILYVLPTGALRLSRRAKNFVWEIGTDTIIEATPGPVITPGAWYHWEWFMDMATGDYEVRIEGIEVLSGNDAAHHSDAIAIVALMNFANGSSAGDEYTYFKDILVWDDTGTQNNDFVGPVSIYSLQVDGDISDTNATPSTGATNWQTMDEVPANDADYTTLGLIPAEMVLSFENVPADVVAIRAAMTLVRTQKTDGGDATVQVGLVSGGDEDTGADAAATTTFKYQYDMSELDPDTATAWTPSTMNAANIRINRTI